MTPPPLPAHCGEYLELALTYLDGEVGDVDVSIVMAHIQQCMPCHGEYTIQREVKYLVQRTSGCSVAPESLRVSIVAQIRESYVSSAQPLRDREERP